jgi:hypothetical protein
MRGVGRGAILSFLPTPLIRRLFSSLLRNSEGDTFSHKRRRLGVPRRPKFTIMDMELAV